MSVEQVRLSKESEVELCEVVITAPDPDWLLKFGENLISRRLASSMHHFGQVRSIYRWKGEVVSRIEGRASLHTRRQHVNQIVMLAESEHPYDVPSVSARPLIDGGAAYLEWIINETDTALD